MASLSSVRAIMPAGHGGSGVPVAALKAAARSGASFVVVCPAGGRAKAVLAALQVASKGAGLVLSSRVVACAAKRSGGVEGDRTVEDPEDGVVFGIGEDDTNVDTKAKDVPVFFVGAGDDRTGEDVTNVDTKANDVPVFFVGAGDDRTGEDVTNVDTKAKDVPFFLVGAGDDRTGEDVTNLVIMIMEELVVMFHKDTAMLLRQVKHFPVGNDETSLASLITSCVAVGEQIQKSAQLLDSPEGRPVVHRLIALHLRIVSCAGSAQIHKRGSSLPDMWSGHRHRLPWKEKRAGSLMELLLYSMMMAEKALERFIGAVEWDFTSYG